MVVMLALSGHTNIEIAQAMGYTPGRVGTILASQHPELLKVREEAAARVMDHMTDPMLKFRSEVPKSIDALIEVRDQEGVENPDLGQKRLAARDILDRAGYSPVRKQLTVNADLPPAQLEEALTRFEQAVENKQRHAEWAVVTIDKD